MLEYHSILITLVRVTLHFYSFLRYVGSCLLLEFEDTANELLSFACVMQDTGVDTRLPPNLTSAKLPTYAHRPSVVNLDCPLGRCLLFV